MYKRSEHNTSNELRDTGVIGAIGLGSGMLVHPTTNALNIKAPINAAVKNTLPIGQRILAAMKSPIKSMGAAMKHEGFKHSLKLGAVAGSLGLIGDYAAVKINNNMNKQANFMTNKYLEKIASTASDVSTGIWQGTAAMEDTIANQYGKERPKLGFVDNFKRGRAQSREASRGNAKEYFKGLGAGGLIGAAAGYGAGTLLNKVPRFAGKVPIGAAAQVAAFIGGGVTGTVKSYKNTAKNLEGMSERMHEQYKN